MAQKQIIIKEQLRNIYSKLKGISRQDDFDYSVEEHLEIISLNKKAIDLIKGKTEYKILQWNLEQTQKKQLRELNYKDLPQEERKRLLRLERRLSQEEKKL